MKQLSLLMLAAVLLVSACKKDKNDTVVQKTPVDYRRMADTSAFDSFYISVGVDPSQVSYEFYMDGDPYSLIDGMDYSEYFASVHGVYTPDPAGGSLGSLVYECNFFTSQQGYIDYGTSKGLALDELVDFEDQIHAYIEEHDLQSALDEGAVPDHYSEYEASIWPFPNPVWLTIYDDIVHYGTSQNIYFKYKPTLNGGWFGPNWNNRVGCIKLTQGYSLVAMYDKTGYKKHLLTVSGWGNTIYSFWSGGNYWWVNDRIESMVIQ